MQEPENLFLKKNNFTNHKLFNQHISAVTAATSGPTAIKPKKLTKAFKREAEEIVSVDVSMQFKNDTLEEESKSKLSNQNALLSLLSNEDLSYMKENIFRKINLH